jgi:hypothetical protein
LRWFSFVLWGFDGFFGLWFISDAQCAGAPWTKKMTRMPFAEWQKVCLDF